ncbi:MAG: alanine racemase [Nocardioidaceae bacterium]
MPLTLRVDGEPWRAHLRTVVQSHPGIVPVAKGNGYGFGIAKLARRADWLGVDTVAVGMYEEAPQVLPRFAGDVLVMTPWRPESPWPSEAARRIIHTLGRSEDLQTLADRHPGSRVVVEGLTTMTRHGLPRQELAAAVSPTRALRVEGVALHLPMAGDRLAEAEEWCAKLTSVDLATTTVFVSHLDDTELRALISRWPSLTVRPRIGTDLWLGNRGVLHPVATVLEVHQVRRGQRVGYRQRSVPRDGWLLVLCGGTAHGIGLEAPTTGVTVRSRGIALAKGGLESAGFALSPFTVDGRRRWFAEPPQMQVSMVFVPARRAVPAVGDEVPVDVRFTTTTFDTVHIS